MTIDRINKISHICAGVSLLFILFALIAPSIFTAKIGLPDYWDFTEKGQIGDTIGGTMGPFIAIAGVLMTFIAFLMQVNANRIQSEQLRKSFDLRSLENKLASRNALELLSVDLKIMILSVNKICDSIGDFCMKTSKKPYGDYHLESVSLLSLNRYHTVDRNLLYDAFQSFLQNEDKLSAFMDVYSIMDFYSDGIKNVYEHTYTSYQKIISENKKELPLLLKNLENNLHSSRYSLSIEDKKQAKLFFDEISSKAVINGMLNIEELDRLLGDKRFDVFFNSFQEDYNNLLDVIKTLVTQNNMLVRDLSNARELFLGDTLIILNEISKKIEEALVDNPLETILTKFENIDNR